MSPSLRFPCPLFGLGLVLMSLACGGGNGGNGIKPGTCPPAVSILVCPNQGSIGQGSAGNSCVDSGDCQCGLECGPTGECAPYQGAYTCCQCGNEPPPPGPDTITPPPPAGCAIEISQPPVHAGIVYVGGFISTKVGMYRIDGAAPERLQDFDVGGLVHELILDAHNDLLFVLQDVSSTVGIYQLHRPTDAAAPVVQPSYIGGMPVGTDMPKFGVVDPLRKRVFIAAEEKSAGLLLNTNIYVFDVSNPSTPILLGGGPQPVPVTVNMAMDPLAGVLFLTGISDKNLYLYDATKVPMPMMAGQPLALELHFPPAFPTTAFAARSMRVDPWRGRLYGARSHGPMSELMAFSYPPSILQGDGACPRVTHNDLTIVPDHFDTSIPTANRPNLLDAFVGLPDLGTGDVFLLANAWFNDTVGSTSLVVPMNMALQAGVGCGGYEGFGCWIQSHYQGAPGSTKLTDGAACLDYTRRVFVGTALDLFSGDGPGTIHFIRYQTDLTMSEWLPADGTTYGTPPIPIAAVCH
jgi:hypothetical protein